MYQYSSFHTYVDCHVTKSKVQAGAVTKDVGARRFLRLSLLAADLLFIPASISSTERAFNGVGSMVTPRRNRLNWCKITKAQSLGN
jgi:hypothetical protein